MRARLALLIASVVTLTVSAIASAQISTGSVAGTVRDSTGGVLSGVTVDLTSPALIEKHRTVTTDESGQYTIIELPPGIYDVTFTLADFGTGRREGIVLTSGFTAVVNAQLHAGDFEEMVTVRGDVPLADTQNVRRQVVLARDIIDVIPSGKSYGNLGVLVPGITVSSRSTGAQIQDVGGTSGIAVAQQLAIHGGRVSDQTVSVNGMSVTNLDVDNISTISFTDGSVQEVALSVGGHSAESESGGVGVNLILKDGGNAVTGSLFANFGDEHLQSDNYSADLRARGLSAPNRVKRLWNLSASMGGPIAKDRLWFFASYGNVRTENYVAGMFANTTPAAWTPTLDTSTQAADDQKTTDGSGRLTWQASARNKLSFYYNYNEACLCHFLLSATRTPEATAHERRPNHLFQTTWTLPMTNRLLLEAGTSISVQRIARDPQAASTEPAIRESASGLGYRAISTLVHESAVYLHQDTHNVNARGSVSYVTGSHHTKIGISFLSASETVEGRDNNGGVSYTVLNGKPTQVTYWALPYVLKFRIQPRVGVFAQDQWRVRRATINAGVRYDYLRSDYPDQHQPPGRFVPVARDVNGAIAVRWSDVSPRLGVAYDLFGTGRTVLKASVNRYVVRPDTAPARAINPVLTNLANNRSWTDDNGDFVVQGDPLDPAANGELGASTNVSFGQPALTARYDPRWAFGFGRRTANWETALGIQHELLRGLALDASYYHRAYVNLEAVDNLAVTSADYDPYCVTAPADPRLPGGGGQRICGLYDLAPAKVGKVDLVRTSSANFGDQDETWNGIDVTLHAQLQAGTFVRGGVSAGRTTTDTCDVVPNLDNPSRLYCHVETPFLAQVKIMGAHMLPWRIQIAAAYQSLPGPQVAANAVFTNAQIAPSLGRNLSSSTTATVNVVPPGTLYGERLHQLDLRVSKSASMWGRRVQGMVDVYNALNSNAVQSVNTTYGTSGSSWLVPTFILSARIVKVGIQVTF